ncbi:MAG TPA: response regulator [Pyrinomonadaceae bacterium]
MTALSYFTSPDSIDAKASPIESRGERPRVLVVEDHEDTRFMLKVMLEKRGMSVVEAADGKTALSLAESERPSLILMDASLPQMDGLAATRSIRTQDGAGKVPIVFLSGHAEPVTQEAARTAGCDAYLIKPIDLDQLAGVLEYYLGKA